jgi:ribosomal protein L16/L10AE
VLKPGRILLEASATPRELGRLREALSLAIRKLPVFAQIVSRRI